MKIIFFSSFMLFLAWNTFAQNRKPNEQMPIDAAYSVYGKLKMARATQLPSIPDLIAMKPSTTLPPNMNDTLFKYDWGELRFYHFEDDPNDVIYTWQFANFSVERYIKNAPKEYYEANNNNGNITLVFQQNSISTNHKAVKVGQYDYITSQEDGKTNYARIVSYQNGILVYDVSAYGTIEGFQDTNRIFRKVFVAIPKQF